MTFAATVLTLYPELFPGPVGVSLAGRALAEGIWSLDAVQIRDFAVGKHRAVDDTPAGGGAGMVLRADVLAAAVDFARAQASNDVRSSRALRQAQDELPPFGWQSRDLRTGVSTSLDTNGLEGDAKKKFEIPVLAITPR